MTDREVLTARGWREIVPGRWVRPKPCTDDGTYQEWSAAALRQRKDTSDAAAKGSVTYRATDEQEDTSPLLAECAYHGLCEREVIEHQYRLLRRMAVELRRMIDLGAIQPTVMEQDAVNEVGRR